MFILKPSEFLFQFLGYLLFFCLCSISFAAETKNKDDQLSVNPLITLPEQLQELEQECVGKVLDRYCEERQTELRNDIKKLRNICRKNPDDSRCGALVSVKRSAVSTIEEFCRKFPHEPRCERRRYHSKLSAEKRARYCAKYPGEKRCSFNEPTVRTERTLAEYCTVFPEKDRCKRYLRKIELEKRRQAEEGSENEF